MTMQWFAFAAEDGGAVFQFMELRPEDVGPVKQSINMAAAAEVTAEAMRATASAPHYLLGGEMLPMPLQPDQHHRWASAPVCAWVDDRSPAQRDADAAREQGQAWAQVRALRDRRLAATDWLLLRAAETGVPVTSEWLDYRQALRDITSQPDPREIAWPVAPA